MSYLLILSLCRCTTDIIYVVVLAIRQCTSDMRRLGEEVNLMLLHFHQFCFSVYIQAFDNQLYHIAGIIPLRGSLTSNFLCRWKWTKVDALSPTFIDIGGVCNAADGSLVYGTQSFVCH